MGNISQQARSMAPKFLMQNYQPQHGGYMAASRSCPSELLRIDFIPSTSSGQAPNGTTSVDVEGFLTFQLPF